jgi:hypothetical protein
MRTRLVITGLASAAATILLVGGGAAMAAAGSGSPNGPGAPRLTPHTVSPAALTSSPKSTYTPIAPCRVVDTRLGGGLLAGNSARSFAVRGTVGFPAQGGHSGGCGVPATATAVTVNVTTTGTTAAGYLLGYATGGPVPLANFMTFHKGINETANPTLPLADGGTEPSLTIKTGPGAGTHLIVDVTGYYDTQIHAVLGASGGILSGTPHVLSNTRLGTGSYHVHFDRDVTSCTPIASIDGSAFIASAYVSGGDVYANTYTTGGVATDLYWTLAVFC